jgi:hypothetical protein
MAEMVINGFSAQKIARQLPPLGGSLNDRQNGIADPFAGMFARTSSPIRGLKVSRYPRPHLRFISIR